MLKINALLATLIIIITFSINPFDEIQGNSPQETPAEYAANDRQQILIASTSQSWKEEELVMVNEIMEAVIQALEGQGLDGRTLLSGYGFRRQHGQYIIGHKGRIAVVNHETREITLSDTAFKRLRGFYIIHELGHVVDKQTGRELSAAFHTLADSDLKNGLTGSGYWLNLNAETDLEEATADAFALWIMSTYQPDYKPVFAYTPQTADYANIETSLAESLNTLSPDVIAE